MEFQLLNTTPNKGRETPSGSSLGHPQDVLEAILEDLHLDVDVDVGEDVDAVMPVNCHFL